MFTVMWTNMCQLNTTVEYSQKPLVARYTMSPQPRSQETVRQIGHGVPRRRARRVAATYTATAATARTIHSRFGRPGPSSRASVTGTFIS